MELHKLKRKFAKFSVLMEPRVFAFIPIAKGDKHPNCQRTFCSVLRCSGANPFLKSYDTRLRWSLDGYNTIDKNFFS